MKLRDVVKLTKRSESSTLEFKRSTAELDRALETLVAFLNAKGGAVLIGVRGDGTAEGIEVSDKTRQQVASAIRQIEPAADVAIEYVEVAPRRTVIGLTCEPGSHGPYTVDGRAYVRVDNTTRRMKPEEYEERVLHRRHATDRWETFVAKDYTLKDLDAAEIQRTYDDAVQVGRLEPGPRRSAREIATRLRVITADGQVLQAGLALFGKDLFPIYPQCGMRLARFRGVDKSEFIDQYQEYGHAFDILLKAQAFIRRNTKLAGQVRPDRLEREDVPEYPIEAVREALVNAICHRDYSIPGGAISVAIYDDRLEIVNTGTMAPGIHVEDLKRNHISAPRNPTIAETFYRRGLIEKWGRGTQKILEVCKAAGNPEPEFEEQGGGVIARFFPRPEGIEPGGITTRQAAILRFIRQSGEVGLLTILSNLQERITDRTLRRELEVLIQKGFIERRGAAKTTRYRSAR